MRYTVDRLKQKIKLSLGDGVLALETTSDQLDNALEDALDIYNDYVTNVRYSTIEIGKDVSVYTLSPIPAILSDDTSETIGTVPDTSTSASITKVLSSLPINPSSFSVVIGTITGEDDGTGSITGTGIESGLINYETGEVKIVLDAAVSGIKNVIATYKQIIREELEIESVLDVEQTDPHVATSILSRGGIYDIIGIQFTDLQETSANYYKAIQDITDMNRLMGAELDWKFIKETSILYIKAPSNGSVNVTIAVAPRIEDIADDRTGDFIKLATACTKKILGRIRSKYKGVAVPGSTLELDGETLLSEANEEELSVRESLKKKNNPPFIHIA